MSKTKVEKKYKASIYLRISKEKMEDGTSESNSISNQRELIYNYLKDKADIEIVSERIDDGYSGATFDRPAVKQMISDIENGRINCFIVKDLSRFGRNFAEAGRYLDQLFPSLGVRVISVNENFDTVNGRSSNDNILLPFLNLINDAYCRDISVKIRSQFDIKRKKGDFISSFTVYGYLKDPNDRHKLIVDEFAAEIVRTIFKWKIEGSSQQRIANRLNELGILSPLEYKRSCGMNYSTSFGVETKAKWSAIAVGRILKNEYYIGTLVQGKQSTPNHKVKKTVIKPVDEWIRIENNHEAIISKEDFENVNEILTHDTRVAPNKTEVYPFSGFLFCGDCKQALIRNSCCKNGKTYVNYMCGKNRTKKECTSHRITEKILYNAVLNAIQRHISNILAVDEILEYIESLPYQTNEIEKYNNQIVMLEDEVEKYNDLKTSLHESLQEGIIDKEEFLEMKETYEKKKADAKLSITKIKEEIEKLAQNRTAETLWIQKFKKYRNIDSIDRRMIVTLIDKIIVFEDKKIEIVFKYQYNYNRIINFIETLNNAELTDFEILKEVI